MEGRLREQLALRAVREMFDLLENNQGARVLAAEAALRVLKQVRGVGLEFLQDWAAWIALQAQHSFGSPARYLVDF